MVALTETVLSQYSIVWNSLVVFVLLMWGHITMGSSFWLPGATVL